MVNLKKKPAKKAKRTSSSSKKGKRLTGHISGYSQSTMVSNQEGQVPVVSSLPPSVDGHLRCFLRVSVPTIQWEINKYPSDVHVQLKWWGEEHGTGILFRPIDHKASAQRGDGARLTSVRYAVCSGPRQFSAYLKDMGPLIFDVVHGPSLILMGQVRLPHVTQLSTSAPIEGIFDVMSTSSPQKKIALLNISLRFESISAAYSQISSSIPTIDMEMDQQQPRHASDENDVALIHHPSIQSPTTVVTHPRQTTQRESDPFESPVVQSKGVRFAVNSPERQESASDHSLISEPTKDKPGMDIEREKDDKGVTSQRPLLSHIGDSKVSSDLIGALLQRGEKLRDAMVLSADEDNDPDDSTALASVVEKNTRSGKLFEAILTSSDVDSKAEVPDVAESSLIDSVFLHNKKALDLVLGEERIHYLEESSFSSPDGSIASEPGDPLYNESLLKDLFYTTPTEQASTDSDQTESTDDEIGDQTILNTERMKITNHEGEKHSSPEVNPNIDGATRRKIPFSKQTSIDDNTHDTKGGQYSLSITSEDSSLTSVSKNKASNPNPDEFIENLGPDKLTCLGRVDAARVLVDSLGIHRDSLKTGTYFVEYSFPTSTQAPSQEDDIAMASELTRIASKRVQDGVVLFNHRSVFPVAFNSPVLDFWWRRPLTFRIYLRESGQRTPTVVGVAALSLKRVLQSDSLSSSASLQIKLAEHSKHSESSSSSLLHDTSGPSVDQPFTGIVCGPLLVKVELMSDGKRLHVKPNIYSKPPLPTAATSSLRTEHVPVTKPVQLVGQAYSMASHTKDNVIKPFDKAMPQAPVTEKLDDPERDPITLYTLLWIPEGSKLVLHEHHNDKLVSKGLVPKNNLYLVCRMFWCDEVSKSRVCWGDNNPSFGFKQVAPVLLNSSLLQRLHSNFMVVEVWNRIGPHDHADQLLGLVKLSLHQLYLSYRDSKITRTLLKSKYPVLAVDEWSDVVNPFTCTQHGQLKVLFAMGSEEQIAAILTIKCGGSVPVGLMSHPDHHLDVARIDDGGIDDVHSIKSAELVEHQFEIIVEDIRGLSVFGSTVWGETDCFVQYHFPFQRLQQLTQVTDQEEIPKLQPHRTPTTLCVPDPSFHDVARHALKLPLGTPVQKHLLAAFTGSWVSAPSIPGSGGVPFELWRRYYYPNIRDQMIAKATLPLAKLCAMVTMQRQGEATIQTFSLPLTVLAGDEITSTRQYDRVHDSGLLDVSVKYQQVRSDQLKQECAMKKEENNFVCLSLNVLQACGLKAAAKIHAKTLPSLSFPAEVGVNAYVVIHFPVGKRGKYVTKTVARTFTPEFSYKADLLVPILVPTGASGSGNISLAEQLEDSEMVLEVWHQLSRGISKGRQMTTQGWEVQAPSDRDVLLGVTAVPLATLLTRQTGIKGWYPISLPGDSKVHDATPPGNAKKVIGGLEINLHFSEAEDRNHVIHISRGAGWSPLAGVDSDDNESFGEEEMPKAINWEMSLKISKAWIPVSEVHSFYSGATQVDRSVKAYVRYKFFNKAPICSRMSHVLESSDGQMICELKHSKNTTLLPSSSLNWHMREENLEVQLWLSHKRHDAENTAKKRDRLVGSAFVDLSSLVASHHQRLRQISGLYPLFRPGVNDLFGACMHVQVSAKVCHHEGKSDPEHASSDEDADISSILGDSEADGDTNISVDYHTAAKPTQDGTKKQQPRETPEDSFTAHILIEQALHLPTVPGHGGQRTMPNVYVSYQTLASVPPSCTSVVMSSTSPYWEYQKLEKISYSALQTKGLEFKLWHTPCYKGALAESQEPSKRRTGSKCEERIIGFVSFDLLPLLAGMRQLIGWYNVVDFNGDCKGQIKLGVSPVTPLSPSRCSPAARTGYLPFQKQDDQGTSCVISSVIIPDDVHNMVHQNHLTQRFHSHDGVPLIHLQANQKDNQRDLVFGPQMPLHSEIKDGQTNSMTDELPLCSTSLLFSQLRQNMRELDTLQHDLNLKLRSQSVTGDAIDTEEPLGAEPSRNSFKNAMEASDNTLKTGKSFAETRLESKPLEVELMSGKPAGPSVSLEKIGWQNSANHVTEKNLDVKLPAEADSSYSGNVSPSTDRLLLDEEGDHFFTLEKNSQIESRHQSIDSEISRVSDTSEDCSVSGYIQDNTKKSKFSDIRDSWLSSEEEDTLVNMDEGAVSPSSSSAQDRTRRAISSLNDSTKSNVDEQKEEINAEDDDSNSVHSEMDNPAEKVKVAETFQERSTEHNETALKFAKRNAPGLLKQNHDFDCEQEHQCKELPRQTALSSHQTTSIALPDFFIPSDQMEESMRALQWSLRSNSCAFQSKLLARSNNLDKQANGKLSERFAKESLNKARSGERPPMSYSESERIARIFNSGNS